MPLEAETARWRAAVVSVRLSDGLDAAPCRLPVRHAHRLGLGRAQLRRSDGAASRALHERDGQPQRMGTCQHRSSDGESESASPSSIPRAMTSASSRRSPGGSAGWRQRGARRRRNANCRVPRSGQRSRTTAPSPRARRRARPRPAPPPAAPEHATSCSTPTSQRPRAELEAAIARMPRQESAQQPHQLLRGRIERAKAMVALA